MYITWIVGNGFDLRAGLKTSYQDFYKSDHVQNALDNKVFKAVCKDTALWADFEEQLGKYGKKLEEKDREQHEADICDCMEKLAAYLKEQQEAFIKPGSELMTEFITSLYGFDIFMREDEKREFQKFISKLDETYLLSIITFNYTNILKSYYDQVPHNRKVRIFGKERTLWKCTFCHVHGTLEEGIILGCDNKTQYNEALFKEKEYLIEKEAMCTAHGSDRSEVARAIIKKTDVFCIYGASIGNTDMRWWKAIAEQVIMQDKRVVLMPYGLNYNPVVIPRAIASFDSVKAQFANRIDGLDDGQKEELKKRTMVVLYPELLFNVGQSAQ